MCSPAVQQCEPAAGHLRGRARSQASQLAGGHRRLAPACPWVDCQGVGVDGPLPAPWSPRESWPGRLRLGAGVTNEPQGPRAGERVHVRTRGQPFPVPAQRRQGRAARPAHAGVACRRWLRSSRGDTRGALPRGRFRPHVCDGDRRGRPSTRAFAPTRPPSRSVPASRARFLAALFHH